MNPEQLQILGRTLARLHNIGEQKEAPDRILISPKSFGLDNLKFLLEKNVLPLHIEKGYQQTVEEICSLITPLFEGIKTFRIHGDCHLGNIISRDNEGLFLIDFDDMLIGPAIQDLWLVNPGYDEYAMRNQHILLEAYQTMREFNPRELKLIEPLRTLRYIHFSAWMAKRWDDPAFKVAFPHFEDSQYWDIQLGDLRQQKNKIELSLDQGFL
jgi:Ser/Thr protein kinase RdoA (MazF antagonist)